MTAKKSFPYWWALFGLLVLVLFILVLPYVQETRRGNELLREFGPRGGTVRMKSSFPDMEKLGLPSFKHAIAVQVPKDFRPDEWHRLEGFARLRDVSLGGASFELNPEEVPRSVDRVALGAATVEEGAFVRPDLTLSR